MTRDGNGASVVLVWWVVCACEDEKMRMLARLLSPLRLDRRGSYTPPSARQSLTTPLCIPHPCPAHRPAKERRPPVEQRAPPPTPQPTSAAGTATATAAPDRPVAVARPHHTTVCKTGGSGGGRPPPKGLDGTPAVAPTRRRGASTVAAPTQRRARGDAAGKAAGVATRRAAPPRPGAVRCGRR